MLLLIVVSGFFFATSLVGQSPLNSRGTSENLAAQALEAQHRGDYHTAARIYKEMLKVSPHSPEVRANLGLMDHLLGDYSAAIREFRIALLEKPQLFVPNLFMGLDLLQVGKPREAVAYLKKAHGLNPRDVNAVLGMGRAYTALGAFLKARTSYEAAVQLDPKAPRAWFGLGLTYLHVEDGSVERMGNALGNSVYFQALGAESFVREGRLNDAIAKYRLLLKSRSAPACMRADLGLALVQSGKFADAQREFETQLKSAPRCLSARLGLARIAIDRGDMTTAIEEASHVWRTDRHFLTANAPILWNGLSETKTDGLESALEGAFPSQPSVASLKRALLTALTRWRRERVQPFTDDSVNFLANPAHQAPHSAAEKVSEAKAIQFYSEGMYTACRETLIPTLSRLTLQDSLLLAHCAYDSGDFRTSFLASQKAMESDPRNPAAWYWRIKASQVLALNALVRAGLVAPGSPTVHIMLGDVYRHRGKFNQAEAEYRKAIQLEPRSVSAHLGLAATFYRTFQLDKALPELKVVLRLVPQNPEANFMMGDILAYHHEFDQAEPYAKAALHGESYNLPLVHALLGKIYAHQGLTTKAIKELQQALPYDHDGSLHYQIAMLYKRVGDEAAAREALRESETLRKKREKTAQETMESLQ